MVQLLVLTFIFLWTVLLSFLPLFCLSGGQAAESRMLSETRRPQRVVGWSRQHVGQSESMCRVGGCGCLAREAEGTQGTENFTKIFIYLYSQDI